MPTVPYDPNPSVKPTDAGTRPIRINTTEDMFGANIGRATEKLGQTLSHVGDEFANTAISFRKLEIETEVNNIASKYFMESGDLNNKFHSMEGNDPQKNITAHVANLDNMRQQYRSSVTSPYGQKLFDQQTMRRFSYDVVNAGGYAATEAKKAYRQSNQEFQSAAIDRAMRDPNNSEDLIGAVKRKAAEDSNFVGDGQDIRESKVKAEVGRAVSMTAMALAKTDPDGAKRMVEKYRDQMHEPQYQKALSDIEDRAIHVKSELEADRITAPMSTGTPHANYMHGQHGAPGENLTTVETRSGRITVNAASAPAIKGFIDDMVAAGAPVSEIGSFNNRNIHGTNTKSQHAFGNAIDWGQQSRDVAPALQKWAQANPEVFRELKQKYNIKDGGDFKDFGHFEWGGQSRTAQSKVTEQGLLDYHARAELSAKTTFPDDPVRQGFFRDELIRKIDSRFSTQAKAFNEQLTTLRNSVHDTFNQKMPDGRLPTSMQDATKVDPSFLDKYEFLTRNSPADKQRVDNMMMKNAKEEIPETQERRDFYTKFLGMSNEERMKVDAYGAFNKGDTTRALADKISAAQANIKHAAEQGQRVDPVLLRNHALLNDMKAYPSRTDAEANQRYQFLRGAAIQRLEDYETQHKAQMPVKEQEQMMKDLTREVFVSKGWFYDTTKRQFELENPVSIKDQSEYNKLSPGQTYIFNGQRARKRADAAK